MGSCSWSDCLQRHYRNKDTCSIAFLFTKQSQPIIRISNFEEHRRIEKKFIDIMDKLEIVWRKNKIKSSNKITELIKL
jgi:hypothetical protein